jgi:transposase
MIVGLVMDQDGRPLCSELWPGNTADVTTLLPVVDRLRARFGVGRICVVADRGMISAATIAALEERKLEYVLGVRERSSAEVRRTVIDDQTPFVPLVVPRASGELTELEAKQLRSARDATSSVAISPRPAATPSSARPSSAGCAPSSPKATRRSSATAASAAI